MNFFLEMLSQAIHRIFSGDAALWSTTLRTLELAAGSTLVAALIGLPLGVAIGSARPRFRHAGFILANAGLGLPAVVLGVFLALLLIPGSPLGWLGWSSTIWGVALAQVLLALPIVVALSAAAVAELPAGLLRQARAFGAGRVSRGSLAVREAWVGIAAALIAAFGSAMAEVGAVVIVGGNQRGSTNTLASTVLLDLSASDPAGATANVLVLLFVILVLGGAMTVIQQRQRRLDRRSRARRLAAGAAVVATAGALAGCGSDYDPAKDGPQAREQARSSIAIDYASYYAPAADLQRLTLAVAEDRGATVRFSEDPGGPAAQKPALTRFLGGGSGFSAVVVAPFDAAAVAPLTKAAADRGVHVVGFGTPVAGQDAQIRIDAQDAAKRLVGHVASWMRSTPGEHRVQLIKPPPAPLVPDQFHAYALEVSRAVEAELRSGGFPVAAAVEATGEDDAKARTRSPSGRRAADVILAWNDATALGAASVARRAGYVGFVGAPAVSDLRSLKAIQTGTIDAAVAAPLGALADALVDVPLALLRGQPVPNGGRVATALYTRTSEATGSATREIRASGADRTTP